MNRNLRGAASLAALLIFFVAGCSKGDGPGGGGDGGGVPKPVPCTSSGDCGADQRCDLGAGICMARCEADNQCPRGTGTRCDEDSGECIAAKTCTHDYNCPGDGGYCDGEDTCYCSPDESVAEGTKKGVCWRVARTCEPCSSTQECGDDPFSDHPAACRTYRVDGADRAVCLPEVKNGCPPGMIQATASTHAGLDGLCVPQSGDCASVEACMDDSDCDRPGLPICDRVRQVCIPGCYFDFAAHRTVGCAPGYVCNATPEGSDPSLLDSCEAAEGYGYGRCEAPCADDDGCKVIDPSYVCRNDGDGKRCRPQGCISDWECTDAALPYRGFCDVETGGCVKAACRVGEDPRAGCGSGVQFRDCDEGFKCAPDGSSGYGRCERMDCVELGGAELACPFGHFCSGESFIDPRTLEPTGEVVELDGYPAGSCGPMDLSAWCLEGCGTPGSKECQGRGPTNYPDSPPQCSTYGLNKFNCFWGCEHQADCPARWNCSSRGLELDCRVPSGPSAQFCETNADCTGGSRCVEPLVYGGPSGFAGNEPFKICECTATDACGAGFSCNTGIATAGVVPGDPTFDKVQARYCTAAGSCGAAGSCEFYGEFNIQNNTPRFFCATATADLAGEAVACPTEAEAGEVVRPGKMITDQRVCVRSSVCQPYYTTDPQTQELLCIYDGAG